MFKSICEKIKNAKSKIITVGTASVMAVASSVPALAAEGDSAIITTMTTAFTGISTQFQSAVAAIGPIALGIFATFFVWKIALKFFKVSTGAAV